MNSTYFAPLEALVRSSARHFRTAEDVSIRNRRLNRELGAKRDGSRLVSSRALESTVRLPRTRQALQFPFCLSRTLLCFPSRSGRPSLTSHSIRSLSFF